MHELSSAGRLAAWGNAALCGAVSPDEAAEEVVGPHDPGHRVFGLPDEPDGVNLPYALLRLRSLGACGMRLVLPRPGDAAGLAGPPAFSQAAVARGEAVVTLGQGSFGLLPEGRAAWSVHPVDADPRTPLSLRDAERHLDQVMRHSTEMLRDLDLARWEPVAAELLEHRSRTVRPALPRSAPQQSHLVLERGLRLAAIVEVARAGEGAAVTAYEMQGRAQVLRDLDRAARRAVEAACSAPVT